MAIKTINHNTLASLTHKASILQRATSLTHSEAFNRIAFEEGFKNWYELTYAYSVICTEPNVDDEEFNYVLIHLDTELNASIAISVDQCIGHLQLRDLENLWWLADSEFTIENGYVDIVDLEQFSSTKHSVKFKNIALYELQIECENIIHTYYQYFPQLTGLLSIIEN